jgi:hypothetical protein
MQSEKLNLFLVNHRPIESFISSKCSPSFKGNVQQKLRWAESNMVAVVYSLKI